MSNRPSLFPVLALTALTITACGNPFASEGDGSDSGEGKDASGGTETTDDLSIPDEWLDITSDAWPDSQGYGEPTPVLKADGECLLFDAEPDFFEETPHYNNDGFGSYGVPSVNYGNEPVTDDNSYRYLCHMSQTNEQRDSDQPTWSPNIQLMVTDSAEHAEETVANFLDQPELPEQTNDVTSVEIQGAEIHTVEREFPTNDGNAGMLEAIFYDEDAGAVFMLTLHASEEHQRTERAGEGIAEDLVRFLTMN